MMQFWMLILLLVWPLRMEWLLVAAQANISYEGGHFCSSGRACYDPATQTIFLNPNGVSSLQTQYKHEIEHHFQFKGELDQRLYHSDKFLNILEDVTRGGRYDEHTTTAMKALLTSSSPIEAHAALPSILHYNIPSELKAWYPWFALAP